MDVRTAVELGDRIVQAASTMAASLPGCAHNWGEPERLKINAVNYWTIIQKCSKCGKVRKVCRADQ